MTFPRSLITCSLLALSALTLSAAPDAAHVVKLPVLDDAKAWTVSSETGALSIATVQDTLAIRFDAEPGTKAELLLAEPVKIPDSTDDFTFVLSGQPEACQIGLDVIIEDAKGKTWYARTKLPGANEYHGAVGVVNTGQLKGRPTRLTLPAFSQPGNPRFFRDAQGTPPRPWTLKGLRFVGDRQGHHAKDPVALYLSHFALTSEAARHSEYTGIRAEVTGKPTAYGGRRVEFCAELDGDPGLPVVDYYRGAGTYQVAWELFDNYAGKPVASGAETITLRGGKEAPPLPLQLAQVIPYPRKPAGTYWVQWRARYFPVGKESSAPADIIAGAERIYVHSSQVSEKPTTATPLAPGWMTVSPMGNSFISEKPEDFGLLIKARKPATSEGAPSVRLTVRTNHLRTEIKKETLPLDFKDGDTAEVTAPLSSLTPGPYKIEVEYLIGDKVYDREFVLTGLKNAPGKTSPLKSLPEGVLDAKAALQRKEPYFHLSPMWHSTTWLSPDRTRWDWFRNFLDQAPTVSHDIEYNTPWSILEPLPGVYDWEEMDLFLAKAKEKNLQVLVWPGFWGEEPQWLKTVPTQAKDGRIFFDFVYDFYGVRQDYSSTPELQKPLLEALRSVVVYTRDNPAVQGYFVIQELPADAPFMNWMSGYGTMEIAAYRQNLQQEFKTPAALSKRWGREVTSFDSVEPPAENASPREWLDWLMLRAGTYDEFMQKLIGAVRQEDPLRPIFVYGDLFGVNLKSADFPALGCAKANGGSHDAMHPFSISQIGMNGVLQRTEDHWPGKWTGYFPEVLDASVFAMSYGGGLGMNCKHYLFTYLPEVGKERDITLDDLRKPPYSLDRFEKFMPIWSAMRPANRMPVEVVELLDTEAGLLTNKALNRNGLWDGEAQLACYRSQINFGADEFPGASKAKLVLMIKSHLETLTRERIDQIKKYIEDGGNVLLVPNSGRRCVETPTEDWVLLKELGFSPPSADMLKGNSKGIPVEGQSFSSELEPFVVRSLWPHEVVEGEQIVANSSRQTATPLLTWKAFGKGKVAVLWGEKLSPRGQDGENGNLLRAAADWAGAQEVMASDAPSLWMNMLHEDASGKYFGLAHAGQWQSKPDTLSEGTVRYRVNPAKTYEVTELITGKSLGKLSGEQIWKDGLPAKLAPREVAIFQFTPQ